ncbi:tachykinin-3 [Dryobates pubescens]|uniref:tachykinin-3 n=1 Tax=Dryobates pubescens TaxID=118200 RepID=UPI0023B95E32|nr:tachykinin-3 [Dryobates pubescens]
MRSRPVLAALLVLALPFVLARRPPAAAAAPPGAASPPAQRMPVPEPLPWRAPGSPGAAYAAVLQLLREEDAGPPAAPQKRDMHDFFVGLMGKRATEPGRPAGRGSGDPSPRWSPGLPSPGGRAA